MMRTGVSSGSSGTRGMMMRAVVVSVRALNSVLFPTLGMPTIAVLMEERDELSRREPDTCRDRRVRVEGRKDGVVKAETRAERRRDMKRRQV